MFADIIETNPYRFMRSAPFEKIVKNILRIPIYVKLFPDTLLKHDSKNDMKPVHAEGKFSADAGFH